MPPRHLLLPLNCFCFAFNVKLLSCSDISGASAESLGVGVCAATFPQRFFHLLTSSSLVRACRSGKLLLRCRCGADSALTYEPPSAPTKRRHQNHLASSPQTSRHLQSAPWFRVRLELVFPVEIKYIQKRILKHRDPAMLRKAENPFQWKGREIKADNVLPPYESGAYTAPLLRSSSCPRDKSGTTFCHHSVKHKSDFNVNPCCIHHLYT